MALRVFTRRAALRLASTAPRPLVAPSSVWYSPSSSLNLKTSSIQDQTRSYAKAKKSKGSKEKNSSASTTHSSTDEEDEEKDLASDDGGAAKALDKTQRNMKGAVVNFTRALNQMRPGRADAGIFDELHVQAYGQHVPLAQVAQVAVSGTYAMSVSVYDPSVRSSKQQACIRLRRRVVLIDSSTCWFLYSLCRT